MDPMSASSATAPAAAETLPSSTVQYEFRAQTGTCTITPTQILLGRPDAGSIRSTLVVNAVIGVFFLALGAWLFVKQDAFAIISVFVGGYMLWSAFTSRNDSAANVIDRAGIRSVEAHAPRPLLTQGYFTVRFVENGEERKRQILVPSGGLGGKKAYVQALAAMKAAGLLEGGAGSGGTADGLEG